MFSTRRDLLKYSIAASGFAAAAPSIARSAPPRAKTDKEEATHVSAAMTEWALSLDYDDLPDTVRHAAKRYILDSIGCAYTGWSSHKGGMAAHLMLSQGGDKQASVLGRKEMLPAASAAFANAELMNSLDYDAIPHTPPVTLPAIMALAESRRKSGADLILATVIAHELASRLSAASSQMLSSLLETGKTPDVFGINTEAALATSLALSRLINLDTEQSSHAMGLAGYYTPPQVSHNWETLPTKTHVKYTPVGHISQSAVNAVLLAETGFTSNPHVLDGEAAFPEVYGWQAWKPERATAELGEDWKILTVDFKPYAACRFIHSQIDCMERLVAKHAYKPDDIAHIETLGVPFTAHPDPMNVQTQEDAQFSTPYNIALAACGVKIDAAAQSEEMLNNPVVRAMMQKISWGVHPDSAATKANDLRSYVARVTVTTTGGAQYVEETLHPRGTWSQPTLALSDADLTRKFVENASLAMKRSSAEILADRIWSIETFTDAGALSW